MALGEARGGTLVATAPAGDRRYIELVWLAAFLLVAGGRLWIVSAFGSALPFWDQWDVDAAGLFIPYLNHSLNAALWLSPQNEHRILTTRILDLLLLEIRGAWDPKLQMMVGAIMFSGFLILLARSFARVLGRGELWLAGFAALVFTIPLDWENTIQGLGYQFYLEVIFSCLGLRLLLRYPAFSLLWLGGCILLALAYLSMASGALVGVAAALAGLLQMAAGRRSGWREALGLALLVAISAAMIVSVPHVVQDDAHAAQSGSALMAGVFGLAAFPVPFLIVAPLLQFPLAWLAVRGTLRRMTLLDTDWLALGIAAWIAGQMLLIAAGRADGLTSSRYLDLFILILPLQFYGLLRLWDTSMPPRTGRWIPPFSGLWVLVIAAGLIHQSANHGVADLLGRHQIMQVEESNTASYLASGNPADLDKPLLEIPYPNAARLRSLIDNPLIRGLLVRDVAPSVDPALPAAVQQRLLLKGAAAPVVETLERAVFSLAPVVTIIGFMGLLAGLLIRKRRPGTATATT